MIIPNYISQIVKMAKSENIDEHFISKNIHTILYELVQISSKKNSKANHQMQHIISYIENNFQQELTLEELAESMNISTYHLLRLFKKYSGKSPYQYILDVRIHHAKKLLRTTEDSIETVAFNSGFNSISHFVTTFKQRTNYTPLQFRKLNF